jgi:dUTPase
MAAKAKEGKNADFQQGSQGGRAAGRLAAAGSCVLQCFPANNRQRAAFSRRLATPLSPPLHQFTTTVPTCNHGCRPASLCEEVRARTDHFIQNLFTRKLTIASDIPYLSMWPAFSRLSANAIIPARGSAAAAGYDLSAAKDVIVPAHGKALVPTDLAIKVPDDCYGRVGMFDSTRSTMHCTWHAHLFFFFRFLRSTAIGSVMEAPPRCWSRRHRLRLSRQCWRGLVQPCRHRLSECVPTPSLAQSYHKLYLSSHLTSLTRPPTVKAGDRIAQLILERIRILEVEEVAELDDTTRGAGGFGSTGVSAPAVASESASKVSKLADGSDVKSAP